MSGKFVNILSIIDEQLGVTLVGKKIVGMRSKDSKVLQNICVGDKLSADLSRSMLKSPKRNIILERFRISVKRIDIFSLKEDIKVSGGLQITQQ